MKTRFNILSLSLFAFIACLVSCSKTVEVDTPKNQLTSDKVFADVATAEAATVNLYALLEKSEFPVFNKYIGSYADECTGLNTPEWNQSIIPVNDGIDLNNWSYLYSVIYQSNNLLEQLPQSGKIPTATANGFIGEALFIRAFAYFYLVNLYGNVPLLTSTDINSNRTAIQSDSKLVYNQIIADLTAAKEKLSVDYRGQGKVRANKWAAAALLARVYLFQKSWALAETEASQVINSGLYNPIDNIDGVFNADSKEAILQLWNQNGYLTDSPEIIPSSSGSSPNYPLTDVLYNAFENGDLRKTKWVGTTNVNINNVVTPYHYLLKYKNRDATGATPEYLMVLRLSEQYLIRSEARVEQGKINGSGSAAEDLNIIRMRAGLTPTTATDLPTMQNAIYQEDRIEFFMEWGHRFFDLKRTGRLDAVMKALKSSWVSNNNLLPIPQNEITFNKNLIQNPGY